MGTQYATPPTAEQRARPLPAESKPTMVRIEPHNQEPDGDPPAAFATDAEIEVADRLRRQLEARYLAGFEALPPLALPVDDNGEELL